MKKDPPIWMAADLESMNIPVDDNQVDSNWDCTSHAGAAN